ncbi:MAG: A24 family peptidase [Pseudomonadota bacterium]
MQSQSLWVSLAGLVGLLVGSFLNVVILRLPPRLEWEWWRDCQATWGNEAPPSPLEPPGLIAPGSRCPRCGHALRAWENVPILSFLWLRGRCSSCQGGISPRYPLVEFLTALLSVAVAWRFGPTAPALMVLLLTWALIALSVIDYDTQLLPDVITLPFLWLGLLASLFHWFTPPASAIIGAMAGYLSLWLVFHGFRLITGKEGMGFGDFKLLALFGAWLGWQQLLPILLMSSLVGALVGISLILFLGRDRHLPIPFGPYLAVAGWVSLMGGSDLQRLYAVWWGFG